MTIEKWLLLVQTLVLLGTGCIIFWYTRETNKMRKEANNQTIILSEQLRLAKEAWSGNLNKERSLAEPLFKYIGGSYGDDSGQCKLINKGAVIRKVEIKPLGADFLARIQPSNVIDSDEQILVTLTKFPKPVPPSLRFEIIYNDRLGCRRSQQFQYTALNGRVEQLS